MAQNIYDDESFFSAYVRLPRSAEGLEAAPEWPFLRAMLPDLTGRRVVDLGCGLGWFCRWAAASGAVDVLGVDLSERMLDSARTSTSQPSVRYERQDLEHLDLPADAFDVAYSSLTLHYLADLRPLLATVHRALQSGGTFVASVEHPVFTAPEHPGFLEREGRLAWPLDGYAAEGPRVTDWLAPGVVKHHRTVSTYVTALIDAGFGLRAMHEWSASADDLAAHPEWRGEDQRPAFLLLAADR